MQRLWPADPGPALDDAALAAHYAYPAALAAPHVRVNFVASADGAVAVDGRSEPLSSPGDKRVFGLLRALADVVLVGAGTARAEGYGGVRPSPRRAGLRRELGLAEVPPIAVLTRSADLDPAGPLLADTVVAPIVLTCAAAPEGRIAALRDAGADVELVGDDDVDPRRALDALDRRGLRRVLCEGGPGVLGTLVAADLVDELCLTVAPLLAGGDAGRIAHGPPVGAPRAMRLAGALESDGWLLLHYRRAAAGTPPP